MIDREVYNSLKFFFENDLKDFEDVIEQTFVVPKGSEGAEQDLKPNGS